MLLLAGWPPDWLGGSLVCWLAGCRFVFFLALERICVAADAATTSAAALAVAAVAAAIVGAAAPVVVAVCCCC